ncbi:MAG TPA: hypothetical protein VFN09_11695 [Rhodanobacteraceae bacterium]|nr:hypothetical protein [Rhodanobacteraceae bacterium]
MASSEVSMAALLGLLIMVALPLSFGAAIAYFMALFRFKNSVVADSPDLWIEEKKYGRPLESWAQPAYRILVKSSHGNEVGSRLSDRAKTLGRTARRWLYIGMASILTFICASIGFSFIST